MSWRYTASLREQSRLIPAYFLATYIELETAVFDAVMLTYLA